MTLDSSRIREYIRKLEGSTRPSPDLVYRSRIKLLKEVPQNFGQRIQDIPLSASCKRHGRAVSRIESDQNRNSEDVDDIKEIEIGEGKEMVSAEDCCDSDGYYASEDYKEKLDQRNENDDYLIENYEDPMVKDEDLNQNNEISDYKINEESQGTDYVNGINNPEHKLIRTERKVPSNVGNHKYFEHETGQKERPKSRMQRSMDLLEDPHRSFQTNFNSTITVVPVKNSENSESAGLNKINNFPYRAYRENCGSFGQPIQDLEHQGIYTKKGNLKKRELTPNSISADDTVKKSFPNSLIKNVVKSFFKTDYPKNKNHLMADRLKQHNHELNERTSENSLIISKNIKNSSDINGRSSLFTQGNNADSKFFGNYSKPVLPPTATLVPAQYLNNKLMFNRSENNWYTETTVTASSQNTSRDSIDLLYNDSNRSENASLLKHAELLFDRKEKKIALASSTDSLESVYNILGDNTEQVVMQNEIPQQSNGEAMETNETFSNLTFSSPYEMPEGNKIPNVTLYDIPQYTVTYTTRSLEHSIQDDADVVTLFEIPQANNQNVPSQNENQNVMPNAETIGYQFEIQDTNLSGTQKVINSLNESSTKNIETYTFQNEPHISNVSDLSKSAYNQNNIQKHGDEFVFKDVISQNNSNEPLKSLNNQGLSIYKNFFDKYNALLKNISPAINESSYQKSTMVNNFDYSIQQKDTSLNNISNNLKYVTFSTNAFDYNPVINFNNKSKADVDNSTKNMSQNNNTSSCVKTVVDQPPLKEIYTSSYSKENFQNSSLTDEEKKLIQSHVNLSFHILSTESIPNVMKGRIPQEREEEKFLSDKDHTLPPLSSEQYIPDLIAAIGRNSSAQKSHTIGFPSLVNTVLDFMASSAKQLLDNPLSDNITSLSIHILGPGLPENVVNSNISSFFPIHPSIYYDPNHTFVASSTNSSVLNDHLNLSTKPAELTGFMKPTSSPSLLENLRPISHYYSPLKPNGIRGNPQYRKKRQTSSKYILPFQKYLNEGKVFNSEINTGLESGSQIFSNGSHNQNETNQNIFRRKLKMVISPDPLNQNLHNANLCVPTKPTMDNNIHCNPVRRSQEGDSREFSRNEYKYLNSTNTDNGYIFKIVGKALDDIGRGFQKYEDAPGWLREKFKFLDTHQSMKTPALHTGELRRSERNFSVKNELQSSH